MDGYMGDADGNRLLICEAIVKRIIKDYDPDLLPEFENIFYSLKHDIAVSRITIISKPIEQQVLARLSDKEREIWLMCLLISELYVPEKDIDGTVSKKTIENWLADAARIGAIEVILKLLLGH